MIRKDYFLDKILLKVKVKQDLKSNYFPRLITIQSPLLSLNWAAQRRRARLMVVTAWALTILFSSPQAVIFR